MSQRINIITETKKRQSAFKGKKHTKEARQKMSEAKIGENHPMFGKKQSEESKNKRRVAQNGRKHTPESRRKMSEVRKGIIYSIETRKKMSESKKGSKSNFWKGGVSLINNKIRASIEYKLWREAVFARDNWTCVWGGKEHGKKINADHIKPFALFPELRFAIDNGRTLCVSCHKTTDTWGRRTLTKLKTK